MAICTKCGAIFDIEDIKKHICNISDIPIKGTEKRINTTDSIIKDV